MKQFLEDNIWVWAGTALVLNTLSGQTRRHGLIISIAAVLITLVLYAAGKDDDA